MKNPINLDAADTAVLQGIANDPTQHPALRRYARLTIDARRLRLRGEIQGAMASEREADKAYDELPEDLRW